MTSPTRIKITEYLKSTKKKKETMTTKMKIKNEGGYERPLPKRMFGR